MAKPRKKRMEPVSLPMLPLRGLLVFPHMVLHFDVGRKKSIAALEQAMMGDQRILLVAQRDMDVDDPTVEDIYHVGTIATVKQVLKLPGDNIRLLVEGKSRAILRAVTQEEPYFEGALDEQTASGKVPVGVARRAKRANPRAFVVAVCGVRADDLGEVYAEGIDVALPILRRPMSLAEALNPAETRANLIAAGETAVRMVLRRP